METCQKRVCQPCLRAAGAPLIACADCRAPFYGGTNAKLCPRCLDSRIYTKRAVLRAIARERAGLPIGRKPLLSRTNVRPGHGPRYEKRRCFSCQADFSGGPNADRCPTCARLRTSLLNRLRRCHVDRHIAVADRIERTQGRLGLLEAVGFPPDWRVR